MTEFPLFLNLKRLRNRLNGSTVAYNLHPYRRHLVEIGTWTNTFAEQTKAQLRDAAKGLMNEAQSIESLDEILPETFGLVYEISRRVLKLTPFDEQLIAGIVMHQGNLVQMQTGEGKTLAAVFPACLQGLFGRGVHILTFNDYLARRDADWMGPIYRFLGFSVGVVREGMSLSDRQHAYASDITYLTAKEAGFDFLRDSLALESREIVQRDFHFAIIDEADSILIDEARIPLIIATTSGDSLDGPRTMANLVKTMKKDHDVDFDDYGRNIHLTDTGLKYAEGRLGCDDLYEENNLDLLTRLNCALHAEFLLQKDKDYIVRNGRVELVDEFTGRIADKRRWPDGLQAAIEAKENLTLQTQGRILNTITLQHFLQQYPGLSGMTATACPAEEEFRNFYGLNIVVIPAHVPSLRQDFPDRLFKSKSAKNNAIAKEVRNAHVREQPVLVGTGSVAESEALAETLFAKGIACEVLNAKKDDDEADIIAQAGRLGVVTISTNMAGRGVDIRLGCGNDVEKAQVAKLGGLYIIGTNKHESARIDDQLRGRAGRQGDPGKSCFFISLEDDLFVKYKLNDLLPSDFPVDVTDGSIGDPRILDHVDQLQRIIEGQNLEIKKKLYLYSDLLEQQRMLLSEKRKGWFTMNAGLEFFKSRKPQSLQKLLDAASEVEVSIACRQILLQFVDLAWSQYLAEIAELRESIHLVRFAGREPIAEFRKQSVEKFERVQSEIETKSLEAFHGIKVENGKINLAKTGLKAPSSTWTYLVNDNPFELEMAIGLGGDIAMTMAAGIRGPLLLLISMIKKFKRKI
jgi:preprotein translocase subunit SecA